MQRGLRHGIVAPPLRLGSSRVHGGGGGEGREGREGERSDGLGLKILENTNWVLARALLWSLS